MIMVSFSLNSLLLAFVAATGIFASPAPGVQHTNTNSTELFARAGTPSDTGTHGGYYFTFWTDGGSDVTYTNLAGGRYTVTWDTGGNWFGGKGWNPGSAR